ncbi:hypothetical protein VTI28DRAFT_8874 [Corynascus sepedonium]
MDLHDRHAGSLFNAPLQLRLRQLEYIGLLEVLPPWVIAGIYQHGAENTSAKVCGKGDGRRKLVQSAVVH